MSQQDILDHFLENGNEWENQDALKEKINISVNDCLRRMASVTERKTYKKIKEIARDGKIVRVSTIKAMFRLKPDYYEMVKNQRECERL